MPVIIKINLVYAPAIPLLGTCPEELEKMLK